VSFAAMVSRGNRGKGLRNLTRDPGITIFPPELVTLGPTAAVRPDSI